MFGDHLRSTNSNSAVLQCDLPLLVMNNYIQTVKQETYRKLLPKNDFRSVRRFPKIKSIQNDEYPNFNNKKRHTNKNCSSIICCSSLLLMLLL